MQPASGIRITIAENGPYLVDGVVPVTRQTIVTDADGNAVEWAAGDTIPTKARFALCRCGESANKPFCDGTHARIGFEGAETAGHTPYLAQATEQDGPTLTLTDAQALCAYGRFCDVAGTVWSLVEQDGADAAQRTEREASLCPSGRLVVWNQATREPIEPHFEPSIGIVYDPAQSVGGPIWVRGGIEVIGGDGESYEVRNRVTLCRCGASANKPFCDASHASVGFQG